MAVIEGLCAMCAAVGMIAWNALITEKRRRERRLHRSKSERARGGRGRQDSILQEEALEIGELCNPRLEPPVSPQPRDISLASSSLRRRQPSSPRTSPENSLRQAEGAVGASEEPALSRTTITTAPAAAIASPYNDADDSDSERGDGGHRKLTDIDDRCSCSYSSAGSPMFRELVMIMDATPLPSPRRKLPEVPEDVDPATLDITSSSSTTGTETISPPAAGQANAGAAAAAAADGQSAAWGGWGCDLSQDFYLCRPFSPPRYRRGGSSLHRRSVSQGNRPRTFSEYTPGPDSSEDALLTAGHDTAADGASRTRCRSMRTLARSRVTRSNSAAAAVEGAASSGTVRGFRRQNEEDEEVAAGDEDACERTRLRADDGFVPLRESDETADKGDAGKGERERLRLGGGDDGGDDNDLDSEIEALARRALETTTGDDVWMVWPTGKLELARNLTDGTASPSPPYSNNSSISSSSHNGVYSVN